MKVLNIQVFILLCVSRWVGRMYVYTCCVCINARTTLRLLCLFDRSFWMLQFVCVRVCGCVCLGLEGSVFAYIYIYIYIYCFVVMETISVWISIIQIGLIFLDFCSFDLTLLATVSQVCVHHCQKGQRKCSSYRAWRKVFLKVVIPS